MCDKIERLKNMQGKEQIAPPPGVLSTIAAGFDTTAKHLWLLVIPVMLDIFFWLGPRLSFRLIIERMAGMWQEEAALAGLNMDALISLAPRTNLFSSLSVPVIGVPAFLVGAMPERTPLPARVIELESVWVWVGLFLLISLVGLLFTAVYFTLLSQIAANRVQPATRQPDRLREVARPAMLFWAKMLGLLAILISVGFAFYIPLLLISSVLSLVSSGLATLVLFSGPVFATWMIFYFSFVPHGLVMYRRPLWRAIMESVQLVQRNLLPAMAMFLMLIGISRGLDLLLVAADDGSWFMLVSILGHAFIGTALFMTTFIFYRDRYAFLQHQLAGQINSGE